jgi:hypothetical protein
MSLSNESTRTSRWVAGPAGAFVFCILGAFIVYGSCIGNRWYNDDVVFLAEARALREDPLRLGSDLVMGFFRPVFTGYIALLNACFGLEPGGYYICGILIHAINAFAVGRLARTLSGSTGAAWTASGAFLVFYSHCEATLWISSHNSSLLACFSLLAVLAHIRAIESSGAGAAVATAGTTGLALFTKETGLLVVLWLLAAESALFGWKSLFSRKAAVRYALVAAVLAAYVGANPKLQEGLFTQQQAMAADLRVSASFITFTKVAAGYGWLFLPWTLTHKNLEGAGALWHSAWGIAALAGPLLIAARLRPAWRRPTAFASILALSGLAAPCMFYHISPNSSRFYYYSTVGAAVALGLGAEALRGALRPRAAQIVFVVALLGAAAWHAASIRLLNRALYLPASIDQTNFLRGIKSAFPPDDRTETWLVEPALPNLLHLEQAFSFFYGIDSRFLRMEFVERTAFEAWLAKVQATTDRPKPRVLQWTPQGGLFAPTTAPEYSPSALERAHGFDRDWKPPDLVRLLHILKQG